MAKKSKNRVPAKKTQTSTEQQSQRITTAQFSGPLPPPNLLHDYNQVVSGAADRILTMAEKNSEHQRFMEKTSLLESVKEVRRGQVCAVFVVIASFITCAITALNGAETTASIVGGTTVIGLVTAFIMGRYKAKE